MKNIILEGIDGTGKSYLAAHLSKVLGLPIHWAGGPPKDLPEILLRLNEQLTMEYHIIDRVTSVSEACYREVLNYEMTGLLRMCREAHVANGDTFIYCSRVIGEDNSGYQDKKHQLDVENRKSAIRLNYDLVFINIPHIKYRAKLETLDEITNKCRGLI